VEIAGDDIKTYAMDHHGLVAAVCKDVGIATKIDIRMGQQDSRRMSSLSEAVSAGDDYEDTLKNAEKCGYSLAS